MAIMSKNLSKTHFSIETRKINDKKAREKNEELRNNIVVITAFKNETELKQISKTKQKQITKIMKIY